MIKRNAGLLAALCMLSACAQEVDVTYNCVPAGATVYQENIGLVGTCPITLKYNVHDIKISGGTLTTDKIRVVWISGTSMMVPPTVLDVSDDHATMTFVHPEGTPDYDKDERFAESYDTSLTPPGEKYISTVDQRQDIFDAYNNSFTCAFHNLIQSVDTECR